MDEEVSLHPPPAKPTIDKSAAVATQFAIKAILSFICGAVYTAPSHSPERPRPSLIPHPSIHPSNST